MIKPEDCKIPELLHKGLRSLREGLHSEMKEKIRSTHIFIKNAEEQRSSLLIQNTRELGRGFLSNTLHTKCDIQKFTETSLQH